MCEPLVGPVEITTASTAKTGRPRAYDRDAFYLEIIVRADLDGLPERQADLIRDMQEWCQKNWDHEPSDSQIKEMIRPIYNNPRKVRK